MMRVFFLIGLVALALPASALDRRAFTFTHYDLHVRLEPWQQRLGVRGHITLRNDSASPQRSLALQISSTLNWSSIELRGQPVQFLSQPYNSDVDHTGALSEAIVTLPAAVQPSSTIELDLGYEGVIPQDATRLTRIGMPAEAAAHSDWDRISNSFSIVRGIGYVAWYPISTEAVLLNAGNTVFEEVGRWQQREQDSKMTIDLCLFNQNQIPTALMNDPGFQASAPNAAKDSEPQSLRCRRHVFSPLGLTVPTFAVANYQKLEKPDVDLYYLPGDEARAENYALAVEEAAPVVKGWFAQTQNGRREKAQAVELPDSAASPFQSGSLLLVPASASDTVLLLSAVEQLAEGLVRSPRAWISRGLARYAQVRYVELRKGRQAALEYLENHRSALLDAEKSASGQESFDRGQHSLVDAQDELYVEAKAMYLWWMLNDMVGDTALDAAITAYQPSEDRDEHYMEKLLEARSHRDLSWFFNDWVYRDGGLPEFHIVSVYPHDEGNRGYMVTVTVENRGGAAAEVPVTVDTSAGKKTERLIVPRRGKATVRILAASPPQEVTVNDGSVPELGASNRPFPIRQVGDSK